MSSVDECDIAIVIVSPYRADVTALIAALDAHLNRLYPPENNHLLDIVTLAQPNIFLLVAEVGGAAIGCGAFRRCEGYAEIKRMYVAPEYRGRHVGRRILLALEAQIRTEGYGTIRLETGDLQPEAIHLYQAMGYRSIPPFGEYLHDPLSRCYEKRIENNILEETMEQAVCLAEDCPCIQLECPIRGNCVVCIRHHREHQRHLPECLQPVLRELITSLAKQVEFDVVDTRPTPEFWEQRAKMMHNSEKGAKE